MTAHRCAIPGCEHDANGIFCSNHYFRLPPADAKWLARLQIMIARSDDADLKTHLREQLHGYTQAAIRILQESQQLSSSSAEWAEFDDRNAKLQANAIAVAASSPPETLGAIRQALDEAIAGQWSARHLIETVEERLEIGSDGQGRSAGAQ